MIKLGIIGLGFVGGAMDRSFREKGMNVIGYDKYKNSGIGSFEAVIECDMIFLALPTPYDSEINKYNLDAIYETCCLLSEKKYSGPIVIKSTVEPKFIYYVSIITVGA